MERVGVLVPSQFGRAAPPAADDAEDDDDSDDDDDVLDTIDASQLRDTTANLAADTPRDLTIDGCARFHGLNTGQQLAFRYFALRLVMSTSGVDGVEDRDDFFDAFHRFGVMADEQQHILLIGEAGTGKSRVINAVRDFAAARGASSAVGVYAYTAIAALLVEGITMSSAARLKPRRKRRRQQQQQQALYSTTQTRETLDKIREEFQNKHIIFIDEVYMVGASFLARFSRSVTAALCDTGIGEAYGGIKTIVGCGDIFQAPPIADAAPWRRPTNVIGADERARARNNEVAIGHGLYRRFDRVFLLWERMRARCQVLGDVARALRTREGIPDWLLRQLNARAQARVPATAESIVITFTNEERHTITDMLIDAAVSRLGERVYFWDHVDVFDKVPSTNLEASCTHSELDMGVFCQYARGNTGSRSQTSKAEKMCAPPSFACHVGMDVVVTKNRNFMLGVVNGARGKVRRICFERGTRFKVRNDGGTQCSAPPAFIVVEFSTPARAPLEGYPQHQRPIPRHHETGTATMGEYKVQYDYMSFALRHGRVVTAHSIQAATYRHPILISNMLSHNSVPPELFVMALTRATTINDVYLMDPLTTAQARRCRAHQDKINEYLRIVAMAFSTMRVLDPRLDFRAIAHNAGVVLDSSGAPVDTLYVEWAVAEPETATDAPRHSAFASHASGASGGPARTTASARATPRARAATSAPARTSAPASATTARTSTTTATASPLSRSAPRPTTAPSSSASSRVFDWPFPPQRETFSWLFGALMAEALNSGTYSYVATQQFQDFTFSLDDVPHVVRDCWPSWVQAWRSAIQSGNHGLSAAQLQPNGESYWPADVQEAVYGALPHPVQQELQCLAQTVFQQFPMHHRRGRGAAVRHPEA